MNTQEHLILSQTDYEKISALISIATHELSEPLHEELERAIVMLDEQLPDDVVSMNSTVEFEDIGTGKTTSVTLVYPPDANISANKVSILTPVGSALIGLRVGQSIQWPFPNGQKRELKVLSVRRG